MERKKENKRGMKRNKRGNSHLYFANNIIMPKSKRSARIFNQLSDIKCLPDSKRSQVTIFIILALAIVFVLVLILIRKPNFGVITTPSTPIDAIKQCAMDGLDNSTKFIMSQGGSASPQNYFLYNGTKVEYLCYASDVYQACVMQKPLLKESIENELEKDLTPKVIDCINSAKETLERKGYVVTYNKVPNVTVELVPGNILMTIDSDLRIAKEKTETYKSIKIDKASKLYELSMITTSIMNYEARYGRAEIMNYMMYYPSLRVEKKKQDDGTTIYILTDKDTGDKFTFAVRSAVTPIGVTGK